MKFKYGYIHDKKGNIKEISAPINSKGKKIKKHTSTKTGALRGGIGFYRTSNKS